MQRLRTLLIALSLATLAAGCSHDPGTSLKIALAYDDALGLDTADVTLSDRTESGRIAHQLLLLVPDELAGMDMMIEVWGRKAGKRAAYGTATAVPRRGHTVAASVTLTACTPSCTGAMLTSCTGPMVSCALGCSEDGDAHCFGPRPSNGVDPTAAARPVPASPPASATSRRRRPAPAARRSGSSCSTTSPSRPARPSGSPARAPRCCSSVTLPGSPA
ncbi:MAG: hypothetical protein E6J91_11335 [Deltaproteobacteria bacterium]|nr:MAG: hypothetical protein E6J91_11335 [Deltaproteobacteria bacterium]